MRRKTALLAAVLAALLLPAPALAQTVSEGLIEVVGTLDLDALVLLVALALRTDQEKVEYDNQNYKRQKLCDDRAVIRQSRHFIQCHNHGYTSLCNVL